MIKNIYFLLLTFLTSYSLFSQRHVKLGVSPPNGGLINITSNKLSSVITTQNSTKKLREVNFITSAPSASLISKASLANCQINSHSQPLQYNKDLNILTFFVNKSNTYTSSINSNNGNIVCYYSLNDGATWDSTLIYSDPKYRGMLSGGAVFNPFGNTIPSNAYLVSTAPINNDTDWVGNFYISKPITIPGTNTNSSDIQTVLNKNLPLGGLQKHHFSYTDFSVTEDGSAHALGELLTDPMATTNAAYGYRGAAIVKGIFSAGAFVWTNDSIIPNTKFRPDGSKYLHRQSMSAWNNSGTVGYIIFCGIEAGAINENNTFQPIIYKTSNSGLTWVKLPKLCFYSYVSAGFAGCQLGSVNLNNIEAVATNSNLTKPFFSMQEGADVTVDNNDQLHIFTNIYSSSSNHNDSLDYIYSYTSEKYSFKNMPNGYITLWDVRTLTNGYGILKIDSMGTEGASGASIAAPGYTTGVWLDGKGGKLSTNARLQLSRSYDGTKLFYTWTETDTTVTGHKWNIYPDIKLKGVDIGTLKMTGRLDISNSISSISQSSYFHFAAPVVKTISSGWEIPIVSSNGSIVSLPYTASSPLNNYFIKGLDIANTSFSVNSISGNCPTTNIKENMQVNSASVFPNPSSNFIHLELPNDISGAEIELINILGELIEKYPSNTVNINIEKLSVGTYFIRVLKLDHAPMYFKFVKE